ncbi:MAG: hypothetical protein Q7S73_00475 [bacterium]|nr:hypothetical protein [bacterium]
MNNKKVEIKMILSGSLISLGLFSAVFTAFAANSNNELKSALKEVAGKVEDISIVKDDKALTLDEKNQKEIEARKTALSKIFDLTLLEDNNLKTKLEDLKNLNENQEIVRTALLNSLAENENAYREMRTRLEEADSLKEIKQLATDFKTWRSAVYNPKVEKIVSFTLIFQQKNILDTAFQRLEKIKSDLEKLSGAKLIKKEDFNKMISKANSNLLESDSLIKEAENLIMLDFKDLLTAPEVTASSTEITIASEPAETSTTSNKSVKKEPPTSKALLDESLNQIRLAYSIFIDISKSVKTKIGLK